MTQTTEQNETEALVEVVLAPPSSTDVNLSESDRPIPLSADKLRKRPSSGEVVEWFAACARCSFFLVGYQLEQGAEHFEEAVKGSKGGWLTLNWSQTICTLVRKSYGSHLDMDCYHYGGGCPDCHRQFVFHADGDEGDSGRLRIELKPRSGR